MGGGPGWAAESIDLIIHFLMRMRLSFVSLIPTLKLQANTSASFIRSQSLKANRLIGTNKLALHQNFYKRSTITRNMITDGNPSPPFQYLSSSSPSTAADTNSFEIGFRELDAQITDKESKRQEAFDLASQMKLALVQIRQSMESTNEVSQTDSEQLSTLIETAQAFPGSNLSSSPLSYPLQDYAKHKLYLHFLSTAALLPPSALGLKDDHYLHGMMGLSQNLARYTLGRATVRDVTSVKMASSIITQSLEFLMGLDFRNGPLRRRYDGVKYARKTCETVLYELSVTGATVEDEEVQAPDAKRMKSSNEDLMPLQELNELQKRMEKRDELRENLIKKCRDGQKAAKQAIYALHRKDYSNASALISNCEKVIIALLPTLEEDPELRYAGSFTNVLEEYVEAKLFQTWLLGNRGSGIDHNGESDESPSGSLLKLTEFELIPLEPEEYLGGLCDLTGEVGRYAVQRGTLRDSKGVQFCLNTNLSILFAMESLKRFPGQIGKKMGALRNSVEKLEKMLYELSLVEATGRNYVAANHDKSHDD